ncbi:hypothetical protein Gotur_034315 [Gossypium turneri]
MKLWAKSKFWLIHQVLLEKAEKG